MYSHPHSCLCTDLARDTAEHILFGCTLVDLGNVNLNKLRFVMPFAVTGCISYCQVLTVSFVQNGCYDPPEPVYTKKHE